MPIKLGSLTKPVGATVSLQQDSQLQRRLQQDSIELAGKTVYLNPFLYWRRFDANTDRWLREPGQMDEEQIEKNRLRFYPEVVWEGLGEEDRAVKAAAVEMFLKSLELISTFNPELTAGQLLELERKMAVTKKRAFERWVAKSLKRRSQAQLRKSVVLAVIAGCGNGRSGVSIQLPARPCCLSVVCCFLAV